MRIRLLILLLTTGLAGVGLGAAVAPAYAGTLLGEPGIAPSVDKDTAGTAEAFPFTATASGSVRSLRFYVESGTTSNTIELGLYSDSASRPFNLLAKGAITNPHTGDWNAAETPATDVVAGTKYWLVVLPTNGTVAFRDNLGKGTTVAVGSSSSTLSTLPSRWLSGGSWSDGPASIYASSDPPPPPPPDATVTVDPSQGLQTVDGLGVNANVHSWKDGELRPAIDKLAQAGVSTWRVIIDRCDFESVNDDDDPSHFNWSYYDSVFSQGKMADLWATMAYIESKPGMQVSLSCMGGVPLWMGGSATTSKIDPGAEDEWVEMLASLVYYARNVKHLDLNLLSPANETDADGKEGPQVTADQYTRLLHKLSVRLDQIGLGDVRFVAPDTGRASTAANTFYPAMAADPVVMAKVARVGIHSYDGSAGGIGAAISSSAYPQTPWWGTEFSAWCTGCDTGRPTPTTGPSPGRRPRMRSACSTRVPPVCRSTTAGTASTSTTARRATGARSPTTTCPASTRRARPTTRSSNSPGSCRAARFGSPRRRAAATSTWRPSATRRAAGGRSSPSITAPRARSSVARSGPARASRRWRPTRPTRRSTSPRAPTFRSTAATSAPASRRTAS